MHQLDPSQQLFGIMMNILILTGSLVGGVVGILLPKLSIGISLGFFTTVFVGSVIHICMHACMHTYLTDSWFITSCCFLPLLFRLSDQIDYCCKDHDRIEGEWVVQSVSLLHDDYADIYIPIPEIWGTTYDRNDDRFKANDDYCDDMSACLIVALRLCVLWFEQRWW